MKKIAILLGCLVFIATACDHKNKPKTETPETQVTLPAFDNDSAYAFVKAQTDFGPRVLGTEAHENCRIWLLNKLREYCDTVYNQSFTAKTYDGKSWPCANLIGSFAPEKTKRIVLDCLGQGQRRERLCRLRIGVDIAAVCRASVSLQVARYASGEYGEQRNPHPSHSKASRSLCLDIEKLRQAWRQHL